MAGERLPLAELQQNMRRFYASEQRLLRLVTANLPRLHQRLGLTSLQTQNCRVQTCSNKSAKRTGGRHLETDSRPHAGAACKRLVSNLFRREGLCDESTIATAYLQSRACAITLPAEQPPAATDSPLKRSMNCVEHLGNLWKPGANAGDVRLQFLQFNKRNQVVYGKIPGRVRSSHNGDFDTPLTGQGVGPASQFLRAFAA